MIGVGGAGRIGDGGVSEVEPCPRLRWQSTAAADFGDNDCCDGRDGGSVGGSDGGGGGGGGDDGPSAKKMYHVNSGVPVEE